MSLHSIYPREDYYEYAYDWAAFHKWGMRNGNTTRNADDHCCGQTYIDLYNICPQPEMIKNIKLSIDMVVNTRKSMTGGGLTPYRWQCLFLPNSEK